MLKGVARVWFNSESFQTIPTFHSIRVRFRSESKTPDSESPISNRHCTGGLIIDPRPYWALTSVALRHPPTHIIWTSRWLLDQRKKQIRGLRGFQGLPEWQKMPVLVKNKGKNVS